MENSWFFLDNFLCLNVSTWHQKPDGFLQSCPVLQNHLNSPVVRTGNFQTLPSLKVLIKNTVPPEGKEGSVDSITT